MTAEAQKYKKILRLILDGQFDDAAAMIEAAGKMIAPDEAHRLTALSAVLEIERGDVPKGIGLIRKAIDENPTWLPHWYRLALFLMDDEQWTEAESALTQLIALSEEKQDVYFLTDAQLRRLVCLQALGRHDEIPSEKQKIPAGTESFIGDKIVHVEDFD